jgi:hypothetical protein
MAAFPLPGCSTILSSAIGHRQLCHDRRLHDGDRERMREAAPRDACPLRRDPYGMDHRKERSRGAGVAQRGQTISGVAERRRLGFSVSIYRT